VIEWILGLFLTIPTVLGSAFLLEAAYRKLDCQRRAFENARAAIDSPTLSSDIEGVWKTARCGSTEARIYLPVLDSHETNFQREKK